MATIKTTDGDFAKDVLESDSTGVPVVKTEDDVICPPYNYKLN